MSTPQSTSVSPFATPLPAPQAQPSPQTSAAIREAAQQEKLRDILSNIHPLAKAMPKIYNEVCNIINVKRPHRQGNWCKTTMAYNFFEWNNGAEPGEKPKLSFLLACLATHAGLSRAITDKFYLIVNARGLEQWANEELLRLSADQITGTGDDDDDDDDETTTKKKRRSTATGLAMVVGSVEDKSIAVKREGPTSTSSGMGPENKRLKRTRDILVVQAGTQTTLTYRHAQTQTSAPVLRETPTVQVVDPTRRPADPPSASTTTTVVPNARSEGPDVGSLEARFDAMVARATTQFNESIRDQMRDVFMTTLRPAFEETGVQQAFPLHARTVSSGRFVDTHYRAGTMAFERPTAHPRSRILSTASMGEMHGFVGGGPASIGSGGGTGRIIEYPAHGMAFEEEYEEVPMRSFPPFHPYRRGY